MLSRGHEALNTVRRRVGLREVNELQRAGRHRADANRERDPRPLLHVIAVAREVDAADRADAPLGIGQAAGVAVDDRVVGDAGAEGVVLLTVGGRGTRPLLLLVSAAAGLFARTACGGR